MSKKYMIGVDGGTESLRAGVFDTSGNPLACAVGCAVMKSVLEEGFLDTSRLAKIVANVTKEIILEKNLPKVQNQQLNLSLQSENFL